MKRSIPMVFCIDVEPDEFVPDPQQPVPWSGYEATQEISAHWRERLEDATGQAVHFSWFVRSDPQVGHIYGSLRWPFEHYREPLQAALEVGDDVGVHMHFARWSEQRSLWLEDFSSAAWGEKCVETGITAYQASFGRRCESVRLGNHFMSQAVSNTLERMGVRYDLTPEPGARSRDTLGPRHHVIGALPDYRVMPRGAHRRSRHAFLERDDRRQEGLFVMPVSTALIDADSPEAARDASDDGAYLRLGLWYPGAAFRYVFNTSLREVQPACIVLVIRSDMPSSQYFAGRIEENLDWICSDPIVRNVVVSRPSEAAAMLTGNQERPTSKDT